MRTPEKAWAVAHKLLHKAAMRLRAGRAVGEQRSGWRWGLRCRMGERGPVSNFGVPSKGWKGELKLSECQDNPTLIAALRGCGVASQRAADEHPYFIGVHLDGLVPDRLHYAESV